MTRGEGERLHAQRQRRFWMTLGALALAGAICGFIAGFATGFADAGANRVDPWLRQVGAAGVVLAAFITIYFSWRFFDSVDEVEVADNLWGSLVGFYAYAILLPAWWAFEQLGLAPPPDHWLIYGIALVTALGVYAWRKWQSR